MDFMEGLKEAKNLGISVDDFKVQWEEEKERKAAEREERRQEREFNMAKLETELKIAELRGVGDKNEVVLGSVKGPKIPVFVDGKDDIDAYLKRFERLAKANNWAESTWADRLGALLTGRALDVYSGLGDEEGRDYEHIKLVLFKKYHLTAEGYRKKLREAKLDREETFTQLAVRLRRYFDRWMELSDVGDDIEEVIDLMIREQLLNVVDPLLSIHLKERNPQSVEDMVQIADLYKDAHSSRQGHSKSVSSMNSSSTSSQGKFRPGNESSFRKPEGLKVNCLICGSPKHRARDCNRRERIASVQGELRSNMQKNKGCFICRSLNHWAKECPIRQQASREGAVSVSAVSRGLEGDNSPVAAGGKGRKRSDL